jgi:hypothetical protein
MDTLLTILVWAIFIFLIWLVVTIYNKGKKLVNKIGTNVSNHISIRELPTVINPIQTSLNSFNTAPLVAVDKSFPYLEESWLSMGRDHDKLKSYASELDSHRIKAEQAAKNAIAKFENDNKLLIDQQRQIFRRAFQAKSLITKFKDIKNVNPNLSRLTKSLQVKMPAIPEYITPEKLEKKYGLLPSNTGHALGRLVSTNGGLTNSGNLIGLAIAAAALAVRAKSQISKLTRVLESAKGDISTYSISLNTTVSLLAKSHEEIVKVSAQLKEAEKELISIIEKVKTIPNNILQLNQLDEEMKDRVLSLYFLILQSDQVGNQKI